MKRVLDNNHQVAHYFANDVQSVGEGSNFFFEDGKLYSYGRHFCIARRLSADVFAFTTRGYSNSTARHISLARGAMSHKRLVYCNRPDESAAQNKAAAEQAIDNELAAAETKRRIKQTTRDGHKAAAYNLAVRFNEYLAALPESERANVAPFDVSNLEELRAAMVAAELRKEEEERKRRERLAEEQRERLAEWRNGESLDTYGLRLLPVALRLAYREQYKGESGFQTIETSHGAEIPASDARALWPVILSVKNGERTSEEAARLVRRLGVYTLNQIRADGSIKVGCHDIAWCEIERMAAALGLLDEVAA